ncbi:MAG: glycoside hydrolase family 97 C-terminal domain-containing protein, partial [Bacteroidales bacterium]|nr:glycoside hydrolase family 97 C-terminal domain-containing protein [Candidatus Cryptobacteroides caccocaballi]
NVVGPMDYTPGTFSDSQHPHFTTYAHELALPILFESTIQHMPDSPESYEALPAEVRALLTGLPTAWDETRLLAGYPGEYAVIARRSGKDWYIAGINGTDEKLAVEFDPAEYGIKGACQRVLDGDSDRDLGSTEVDAPVTRVICRPRGGFVMKTI